MGSVGTEVNAECKRCLWLHVHEMIGCLTQSEFTDLWCCSCFLMSGFSSLLSFKQVFMPQPFSCRMPGAANYLNKHVRSFSLLLLLSLCRQHSLGPHLHKQLDRLNWLQPSCCSYTHPVWSMSPDELLTLACLLPIWLYSTTLRPADF